MHAFGYQGVEKQKIAWVATIVSCVVLTIAIQIAGFLKRRQFAVFGKHGEFEPAENASA